MGAAMKKVDSVLVIDDDPYVCSLLKTFLERYNFSIDVAYSGREGLEKINTQTYNIVLCDFRLRDMTGKDVLVAIKKNRFTMPVIIITGYSDIKIAVEVMKLGAYDYATKPLFPDEILLAVRQAISSPKTYSSEPEDASIQIPESADNSTKSDISQTLHSMKKSVQELSKVNKEYAKLNEKMANLQNNILACLNSLFSKMQVLDLFKFW
jgi:two-component system response regulator HydG